jgi:toxin HigB-1
MIRSFKDRKTEDFFGVDNVRQFSGFKKVAQRKLVMLDSAVKLGDLAASPGNRLEKLSGDRAGQYSIRINDQWRICFTWKDDGHMRLKLWIIIKE